MFERVDSDCPVLIPVPIPPIPIEQVAAVYQEVQQVQIDNELRIEYRVAFQDFETGLAEFTEVRAWYGPTELRAARLVLDKDNHRGWASGGIELIDPLGNIVGESLEFDWIAKTGSARDVTLTGDSIRLRAEELEVLPDHWILRGVSGTLDATSRPIYSFDADALEIYPGRRAIFRRVTFRFLGMSFGPFPEFSFSLDPSSSGLNLPSISNRPGSGIGVSWNAAWKPSSNSILSTGVSFFPNRYPGYSASYIFTPTRGGAESAVWVPEPTLGERVSDGYFNHVGIASPQREFDRIATRRETFAIGTIWNQRTIARTVDTEDVTIPLELIAEQSGTISEDIGYRTSIRAHAIRDGVRNPYTERLMMNTGIVTRPFSVGDGLALTSRFDFFGTASSRSSFGFGRAEAGVHFAPSRGVGFGVAYVRGVEWGTPDFEFDRLFSRNAVHTRLDLEFGPYSIRVLYKFDFDLNSWYDREYELAFKAGGLQPYVVIREFPSQLTIGLRFSANGVFDRLTEREIRR